MIGGSITIGVLVGHSGSSSGPPSTVLAQKNASKEVFLNAANVPGLNPFTPSVAKSSSTGAASTATVASTTTTVANAVRTIPGNTVGLYGGTLNYASCDQQQMINYLTQNPALGRAWAQAENIPYSGLPSFINSLTPVILRADTRVTDYGYANSAAYGFQAVLQAGTDVLIDDYGIPRAKCYCGNPLQPPVATTPTYYGTPWPAFSPTTVVVVTQVTQITNVVIVDTDTGSLINRPIGSNGNQDSPFTPPSTTSSTSTTTTTATTLPPVTTPGATLPVTTSAPGYSTGDALNVFYDALDTYGGTAWLLDQQETNDGEDPNNPDESVSVSAYPTGDPNVFTVVVDMDESDGSTENTYTWSINFPGHTVTPTESNSESAAASCGGVG